MEINDLDQHLDHGTSCRIRGGVYAYRRSTLSGTRFQPFSSDGTTERSPAAPPGNSFDFSIPSGVSGSVADSSDDIADMMNGSAPASLDRQDKN